MRQLLLDPHPGGVWPSPSPHPSDPQDEGPAPPRLLERRPQRRPPRAAAHDPQGQSRATRRALSDAAPRGLSWTRTSSTPAAGMWTTAAGATHLDRATNGGRDRSRTGPGLFPPPLEKSPPTRVEADTLAFVLAIRP